MRPHTGAGYTPTQLVSNALQNSAYHVRPAELGRVNTIITKNDKTDTSETAVPAVAIDKNAVSITIDAETGNIKVSFPARQGWKYQYQIDGGNWTDANVTMFTTANPTAMYAIASKAGAGATGTTGITGITGASTPQSTASFTIAALTAGEHSIALREVNTRDGKTGAAISIPVSVSKDAATTIINNTVSVTHNSATIALSITDTDGVKDYTCKVMNGATQQGNVAQASNNLCSISNLPANTALVMVENALVAVKKADGSIAFVAKEVRTPFQTKVAPDTTAPAITLVGAASITITQGTSYTEQGATCADNIDTACSVVITGAVDTAVIGVYTRTYTATDAAGNTSTRTRTVNVSEAPDTVAPVITLSGASTMSIVQGGTYTEPGASCVDNKDATCTVVISGSVDTAVVGTYTRTYTATDAAGNTSTRTRTVNVTAADPMPT